MKAEDVRRMYEDLMYSGHATICLSHLALHEAVFEAQDLKCSVWVNCDLTHATFINCDLRGSDFTRSQLEGARFIQCDLRVSDFPNEPTMEIANSVIGAMWLPSMDTFQLISVRGF